MRGTLHLMTAEDLRWLLPYFGPLFIQKGQRRYRQLGLDAQTRARAAQIMVAAIRARGPLIRAELAEVLAAQDIPVAGQAIAHLVGAAALAGQLCFGPEREGKLTHVVLEDWLGWSVSEETDGPALLAQLARRYLHAYGPASAADYASWAGIGLPQARAAFQVLSDDLLQVSVLDETLSMLRSQAAWLDLKAETPLVHFLPRYDTYLLGYTSRAFMVAEAYARRIHPGGGQIQQSVILDGHAIGAWRNQRQRGGVGIVVEPFEPLDPALRPYLEAEVEDIGRFLGEERTLEP